MPSAYMTDADYEIALKHRRPVPAMLMLDPAGESVLVHRGTLPIRDEQRVTAAQASALLKAGAMDGR